MPESPLDIAILLDDQELIRLVATWPKLNEEYRKEPRDVAIAANISSDRINALLFRAKMHGLIYDDGKINGYAQKYISGIIGSRIAEQVGKTSKAKK